MQLTDEPDKRCYPLDSHLLCRSCHISHLNDNPPELEVKNTIIMKKYKNMIILICFVLFFI